MTSNISRNQPESIRNQQVTNIMSVCPHFYRKLSGTQFFFFTPYCHLWSARLSNNFPHYLTNGMILECGGGELLTTKYVF